MSSMTRKNFLKGVAAGMGAAAAMGAGSALAAPAGGPGGPGGGSAGDIDAAKAEAAAQGRVFGICGPGDWLGEAPVIGDDEVKETLEYDVVVIGCGHAGIMAAVGAIDEGAKTAVIETQPWGAFVDLEGTGANMGGWYGEDIGHVNSQWLIDRGFGPYNTGEIAYEFVKRSLGRCNPDVLKGFAQQSGPMFDRQVEIYESYEERRKEEDSAVTISGSDRWGNEGPYEADFSDMLAEGRVCTQCQYPDSNPEYPIVAGDYKTWPCNAQFYGVQGNNIEYWNKYMVYYGEDHGGDYYWEHTAVVLTQDADGAVTGVIAEDLANGGYKKFVAKKGVVIAAGDFIGNPDMCWALLNEGMEWGERGGYTKDTWTSSSIRNGQGIKMGIWAGGMIEPSPRGWMSMAGGPSGPWGACPLLQLNCLGKRFYNEAGMVTAGAIVKRQPEGAACWVSDSKVAQSLVLGPLDHAAVNFGEAEAWDLIWPDLDAVEVDNPEGGEVMGTGMGFYSRKSTVYKASTLEGLAAMLGYEGEAAETFVAEIKHYNELCYAGADTDYGKDAKLMIPVDEPPFIGGTGRLSSNTTPMMVTLSGLMSDGDQRVVRDGKWTDPIKGLYACGNSLGGRYGLGYSTPFAGNSIGQAMTTGWIAGKNAAQGL